MKKLLILMMALMTPLICSALMLENSVIRGEIKKFDTDTVSVQDIYGKIHVIKRDQLSKDLKLNRLKYIEVPIKVERQSLKINNLPYEIKKLEKLNKKQWTALLYSYQVFAMTIDLQMRRSGGYKVSMQEVDAKQSYSERFMDYFIQRVIAGDEDNFRCFWGGWPSDGVGSNGVCRAPYSSRGQASLSDEDPMKYKSCGGDSSVYRCNPVLFGPSTHDAPEGTALGAAVASSDPSVSVRPVPNADAHKGICIVANNATQVVERCLKASKSNLGNIISNLQSSEAARASFARYTASIAEFCRDGRNSSNSACGNLRERLYAIDMGLRPDSRTGEIAGTCTHDGQGSFGLSAGESATDSAANSCPGSLCYVRAICAQEATGSASAAPLPITAVCSCSLIGGAVGTADNGGILACINDRSIASLVPSNRAAPASEAAEAGESSAN